MKTRILFATLLALALFAAGRAWAGWDGRGRLVTIEDEGITVLAGEEFQVVAGPRGCQVMGGPVTLLGITSSGGSTRCGFRAGQPGADQITLLNAIPRLSKRVPVKVAQLSALPRLTVAELTVNPVDHQGKLFIIAGKNLGSGPPSGGSPAFGARVVKTDWVLEDSTGAVTITGSSAPAAPEARLVVLIERNGRNWVVRNLGVDEIEVQLLPDVVNELWPGQVAVIPVWNTKSTWAEPVIKGDAVTVQKGEVDLIRLHAEKPGEAEVQIFMRWWNQDVSNAIVGGETPQKPEAVYLIKVIAPGN